MNKNKKDIIPLVSIITVCKNSEKYIEQAIQSVIYQSYKNIQYIIIDGKSTDNTFRIINKYKKYINYFISEYDSGIYDAWNKGIKVAKGDLIGILNSDDYYEKDAVEVIVNKYKNQDYSPGLYYGNFYRIDHRFGTKRIVHQQNNKHWLRMGLLPPGLFVSKSIYENVGLYSPSYKFCSDYEFLLKCIRNNVNIFIIDNILANFRTGGATTKYSLRANIEAIEINKKYYGSCTIRHLIFVIRIIYGLLKSLVLLNLKRFIFKLAKIDAKTWDKFFKKRK